MSQNRCMIFTQKDEYTEVERVERILQKICFDIIVGTEVNAHKLRRTKQKTLHFDEKCHLVSSQSNANTRGFSH